MKDKKTSNINNILAIFLAFPFVGNMYLYSPQFIGTLLFGFASLISKFKFYYDYRASIFLLCSISMSILLLIQSIFYEISLLREFGRLVLPYLMMFLILISGFNLAKIKIWLLRLTIICIGIETLMRVDQPLQSAFSFFMLDPEFYNFKSSPLLFFIDSNHVAILILLCLAYSNKLLSKLFLFILLFFSFSRAALIFLFIPLISFFSKLTSSVFYTRTLVFLIPIVMLLLASFLDRIIGLDDSGSVKVAIIYECIQTLSGGVKQALIGNGAGLLLIEDRYTAHSFFGFVAELGLLGWVILSYPFYFVINKYSSRKEIGYFISIFIIFWISLFPVAYMLAFYLIWFSNSKNEYDSLNNL